MEMPPALPHYYPHQPRIPGGPVPTPAPTSSHSHSYSQSHQQYSSVRPVTAGEPPVANVAALVAMEELYELERSEALRRAEYEQRRFDALRRAEAGLGVSLGPHHPLTASAYSASHHPNASATNYSSAQADNHLPGHYYTTPPHLSTSSHAHASKNAQRRGFELERENEESPSPTSTDSESVLRAGVMAPTANTPSTSPFLVGIRQLGIHSTEPSRAPSPILLPPPRATTNASSRPPSPHHAHAHSSAHAFAHQHHPYAGVYTGNSSKRRSYGGSANGSGEHPHLLSPSQSPTRPTFAYSNTRTTVAPNSTTTSGSGLGTPVLSSGPSSTGSSPGVPPHALQLSGVNGGNSQAPNTSPSTTPTASSASPPFHVSHASTTSSRASSPNATQQQQQPPHSHLASSLRLAFGMTPIRPAESHQRSTATLPPPTSTIASNSMRSSYAHPFSNASSSQSYTKLPSSSTGFGASARSSSASELRALGGHGRGSFGFGMSLYGSSGSTGGAQPPPPPPLSLPGSRAPSPPITLAPLRIASRTRTPPAPVSPTGSDGDTEMDLCAAEGSEVDGKDIDIDNEDGGVADSKRTRKVPEKVVLPHFSEIDAAVRGMDLDSAGGEGLYAPTPYER